MSLPGKIFLHVFCFWMIVLLGFPVEAASYQYWSDQVFAHIEEHYGQQALKRFHFLHDFIVENQDVPVQEKLELVNRTLNNLPWIADQNHWKTADYWATPLETIATFGGDCEDIAIAKWVVLNHLRVQGRHLRLAYVKIRRTGESHMVLLYIDNPQLPLEQQAIFVLDNLMDKVRKASERKDLLAVFITDADGNLVLLAENNGKVSVKGVYRERKMKKIEDLKKKIAENTELFTRLNGGRPLLPQNE